MANAALRTAAAHGARTAKKAVWRCISRLDHGTKYCKDSPTLDESVLQDTILEALTEFASQNTDAMEVLKQHIGMGLSGESDGNDPYTVQVGSARSGRSLTIYTT